MRHRLVMSQKPTTCALERFANEMNWCHVGRYLFALNRPGSTTSSQAASRSRIYVSSCDGCTGSSQPVAIGPGPYTSTHDPKRTCLPPWREEQFSESSLE